MKIVYRANDIIEAHIVAGMLRAQGLDSHVGGHYLQGAVGDLSPLGFATVMVSDQEYAAAEGFVAEYEAGRASTNAPLPGQHGYAT